MISARSSSQRHAPSPPAGFFVSIYSVVSRIATPLRQRSPFHWHVLFSSPSSISSSASSSSTVQYRPCTSACMHVLQMTRSNSDTTHCWIGQWRSGAFIQVLSCHHRLAMCALSERWLFFFLKCTLPHKKNTYQFQMNGWWMQWGSQQGWQWGKNQGCKRDWEGISRWNNEILVRIYSETLVVSSFLATQSNIEMLFVPQPYHVQPWGTQTEHKVPII